MAITFTKSFVCSDENVFGSLGRAQEHELCLILKEGGPPISDELRIDLAAHIVRQTDRIVDILTTRKSSRPTARKVNGAVRKRNQAAAVNAALQDSKQ
jgi:hypothetical protein